MWGTITLVVISLGWRTVGTTLIELTGANPLERFHEDGIPVRNADVNSPMLGNMELAPNLLPPYETGQSASPATASPEEEETAEGGAGTEGEAEHQADGGKDAREAAQDNQEGDDDTTGADGEDESNSSSSESESSESVEEQGESAEGTVNVFFGGRPASTGPGHLVPEIGPLPEPLHLLPGSHVMLVPPRTGQVRSAPLVVFPYSQSQPSNPLPHQHAQPHYLRYALPRHVHSHSQLPGLISADLAMAGPGLTQIVLPSAPLPESTHTPTHPASTSTSEMVQSPTSGSTSTGQHTSELPTHQLRDVTDGSSLPTGGTVTDRGTFLYSAQPNGVGMPDSTSANERLILTGSDATRLHGGSPISDASTRATETSLTSYRSSPSTNPSTSQVSMSMPRALYKRELSLEPFGVERGVLGRNVTRKAGRTVQERFRPRRIHGSEKKQQQRKKLLLNKWLKPGQPHNIRAMFPETR